MAKKSFLTLLVLGSLLGFYFLYVHPLEKTQENTPKNIHLFPCRSSEDITAIEIEKKDESILRLEKIAALPSAGRALGSAAPRGRRGEAAWQMTRPYAGHADQIIAGGMAVALCQAESIALLSFPGLTGESKDMDSHFRGNDKTLSQLGLDLPDVKIKVLFKDTSFQKTLSIGRKHPVRDAYYAAFSEEPGQAFLLGGQLIRSLNKSDYALREKRIFSVQGKKVTRITLNLFGSFVRLFYGLDRHWHMQEKPDAKLDERAVEDIFDRIQHLYVKEFLYDENPKEPQFGIAKSDNFLSVIWEDGESETLSIGKSLDERNAYYAIKGPEDSPLVLVAKPNIHALARLPEDFIDSRVLNGETKSNPTVT